MGKSYRPPPPTLHGESLKTVTMATTEDLQYMYDLLDKKVPGLLHQGFGYVLLVVFATYMVAFIQGFLVGKAREKYKVELPTMYSDTEQMFNCYQGAPEHLGEGASLLGHPPPCRPLQLHHRRRDRGHLGGGEGDLLYWLLLRGPKQQDRWIFDEPSCRLSSSSHGLHSCWQ